MLWILVTVLVGLVIIIVQLLLSYQKRAARIKIAHTPVRKMIDDYKQKITDLGNGVRSMANESLVQLEKDLVKFQQRSGKAANLTSELDTEAQAWVAERTDDDAKEQDDDELLLDEDEQDEESERPESGDELLGGRKDIGYRVEDRRGNPVEVVRAIRRDLEETYEYIEGLRTDATLVQQSLQWLSNQGKGKEGANGST
ncbi:MAG: hypothetical protein VCE12_02705 [Candidatus Latescibacterota bacterium]